MMKQALQSDRSQKRQPLMEKQPRARPSSSTSSKATDNLPGCSPSMPHHESLKPEYNLSLRDETTIKNKHLSAVADAEGSKRNSNTSNLSTGSRSKRKTHVGPWQLGRTLGKGATGRVRLAKHSVSGQTAAVKIVSKKSALLLQSDSIANIDKIRSLPKGMEGVRTMPFGIEREIVIMKLIEHPNIINLYDIWENRGELYLVLEYVEGGELFEYVSTNGALPEVEAVRLFRQILAALSYCHRFNICHRDLKPENILLDAKRNVKLADFGLAALQPLDKWLSTSCGSPHYAAPEVIAGHQYMGTLADVWSAGIILYAMLHGCLPFDGTDLLDVLAMVRKGEYFLSPNLSVEASDLIQRMLQKDPEHRIETSSIWRHPLMKKYERLHMSLARPQKLVGPPPPLTVADCERRIKRNEIDPEVLRNLQTLWHGVRQEELVRRLISDEPNHEKIFYWALIRFREEQMENYPGDPLRHSASDYHHATKPTSKLKKPSGIGHTRRPSQFSLLSSEGSRRDSYYKNVVKPTSKTTQSSYDPYRASRTPIISGIVDGTTVTVWQPDTNREWSGSVVDNLHRPVVDRSHHEVPPVPSLNPDDFNGLLQKTRLTSTMTSRSSLASSRYDGTHKSASYKRKVSFRHARQRSANSTSLSRLSTSYEPGRSLQPATQQSNQSFSEYYSQPNLSSPACVAHPSYPTVDLNPKKPRVSSQLWRDDTRKVSAELSKICEEAFNRSSISSGSEFSQHRIRESPATTVSSVDVSYSDAIKNRPLPPTPALRDLIERRQKIIEAWGDADLNVLTDIVAPLDRKIQEESRKTNVDSRSASDPIHAMYEEGKCFLTLGSSVAKEDIGRTASDPVRKPDVTIRLVTPDPLSPMRVEPLTIRKNRALPVHSHRGTSHSSWTGFSEQERGSCHPTALSTIEEHPNSPKRNPSDSTMLSRKWSWLSKRAVGSNEDLGLPSKRKSSPLPEENVSAEASPGSSALSRSKIIDAHEMIEKKKGWFQKVFNSSKKGGTTAVTEHEIVNVDSDENETADSERIADHNKFASFQTSHPPATSVDAATAAAACKPIEINQNWFAKIFHLKPASRVIVLQISKVRARKEVLKILREWRKFGLRDVVAERLPGANLIRGRVDAANYLHIKPVSFHAHLYAVLERGRRANLSIIKLTQEKGAASSFYRVGDTLESVLKENNYLVTDGERKRGILKGVKEAGL